MNIDSLNSSQEFFLHFKIWKNHSKSAHFSLILGTKNLVKIGTQHGQSRFLQFYGNPGLLLGRDVVSLSISEFLMGFNSARNPVTPGYQTSRDSGLPDTRRLQTTRHLWAPGYQTFRDSRLPDIRGLQTTRHLWTPGYQTSGDFRLPDIYGLQATRHPGTSDYQTSMDSRLPGI